MSEDWYLYKNEVQQGPYSWTQLYQEAQSGRILPDDLVWNQNLQNWIPASQVPGLIPQAGQAAQPQQDAGQKMADPQPSSSAAGEGKGLFVAFIAALIVFLGLSGYIVYLFFFAGNNNQPNSETTTLPETTIMVPTTTVETPTTTTAPPTTTVTPTTTTTARPTTTTTTTTTRTTTTTAPPSTTQTTNSTWWIMD